MKRKKYLCIFWRIIFCRKYLRIFLYKIIYRKIDDSII